MASIVHSSHGLYTIEIEVLLAHLPLPHVIPGTVHHHTKCSLDGYYLAGGGSPGDAILADAPEDTELRPGFSKAPEIKYTRGSTEPRSARNIDEPCLVDWGRTFALLLEGMFDNPSKQAHFPHPSFGTDPHKMRGAECSKRNAVSLQRPVISLYSGRFTKHEEDSDLARLAGKKRT